MEWHLIKKNIKMPDSEGLLLVLKEFGGVGGSRGEKYVEIY